MIVLLLLLAVSRAAFGQQLTLQSCNSSQPAQRLTYAGAGGTLIDGSGSCITGSGAGGAVSAAPCAAGGSAAQRWTWHADDTVESGGAPGQCFNAFGGAVAQGTPIVLYSCGSRRALAANDVFVRQGDGTVLGKESGLCLSSIQAPPAPPAPSNGSCASDWDCSLNGACTAGKCACYAPWSATLNCESLAFLPSPLQRGYPAPGHNETTWGGSIALDPVGGLYHMYVAEMMNECPLNTWGQNSRCTHATSATPLGPFLFSDVAVTNWCHNPAITVQKNADGSYLWALFHIGDGVGGSVKNCSSGGASAAAAAAAAPAAPAAAAPAAGATLHTAPSPNGPWTPVPGLPSCNNPAPFLVRNGSYFIICDGFQLYAAPSVTSAWTHVTTVSSSSGTPLPGNYEDPFFWIDARGNWHIIYHVYRTGGISAHTCIPPYDGSVVAGHYFSKDGFTWRAASVAPYGNIVDLVDGSQQLLTTRERPKMIFNAAGDPTHLSNGVCPSPGNFNTPVSCPDVSTGCVDCKYDNWDFTNVSPLAI